MLGMKILLPIILVVGGAGFAYHKVVINEKDNRIAQQQMDIAACTQQKLALDAASENNTPVTNVSGAFLLFLIKS